ncbi:UNC-like C-terminal-domain-containing protein [Pyrenochaeta sp. MPI-SDFR-AT-0127]|nr:UNC-like C-terminal-domain-containing protein [Pyrenochaeta sp. MPI-SDFR-AT-0127]
MSQLGNLGAPTPRRSNRLSTKASSVADESAVTQLTNGGSRLHRKGPLTKVKTRKSNAYGASGRVGAAEELAVSATGFAQAFQNQRGDAFARDDEEEDEDDDDDIDELGAETPRRSGALNGNAQRNSTSPLPQVPSRVVPGLSFLDSEDITPSDDDLAASVGNTSKSFGMNHEGGMLLQYGRREMRFSSQDVSEGTPLLQKTTTRRSFQARTQIPGKPLAQPSTQAQATPERAPPRMMSKDRTAIENSVDDLIAEEQARLQREGPPKPQPQHRLGGRQRQVNNPPNVDEWLGNVEPPHVDEVEWPWKKYIIWAFWSVIASVVLSILFSTLSSSGYPESVPGLGMGQAFTGPVSRTWHYLAESIMPRRHNRDGLNEEETLRDYIRADGTEDYRNLWSRVRKLNEKVEGKFDAMRRTLQELREELPQHIVVHRHPDGRREISDEFWTALLNKVDSQSDDAEWISFLKRNRNKVDDIIGAPMDGNGHKVSPEAVPRHEFIDIMQQHYKNISARVDEKFLDTIRGQSEQIAAVARLEAKKVMMDQIRLASLAQSNLVANYELVMRKVNYFSPGLGAYIDPTLTSATFSPEASFFFHRFAWITPRNPPKAALTSWEEVGDCWCATPDAPRSGRAQLAVNLGQPMFPNQVTIEHVPMNMVPTSNINNAPRHIEVWTDTDEPVKLRYNHMKDQCQNGPDGWQCLGSFVYNIHSGNHIQTFDLDAATAKPISKIILRVLTNWGGDHTCLYRVRLHGDAPEEYKYTTFLDTPVV